MRELPTRVEATHEGFDESRSSFRVQIGTESRTIGYAWAPVGLQGEGAACANAKAIAEKMIKGWNLLHQDVDN